METSAIANLHTVVSTLNKVYSSTLASLQEDDEDTISATTEREDAEKAVKVYTFINNFGFS